VLYERRGTPVLRSARPELVVPKPWTSRRWTEALNSRLWPRACAATGKRASMVAEPRPPFSGRCLGGRRAVSVGCNARMHRGERGNGVAGRSRLKAGLILRVVWIVRDLVRSGDSGAADDTVAARAPLHRGPITSRKAQASGILITVMTATTRMASSHSHRFE
jgi:hypothetical protein